MNIRQILGDISENKELSLLIKDISFSPSFRLITLNMQNKRKIYLQGVAPDLIKIYDNDNDDIETVPTLSLLDSLLKIANEPLQAPTFFKRRLS